MRLAVQDLLVRMGEPPVSTQLSFTLDPGEILVLDGSPEDRTHFLRAIAGLDPVKGALSLDGRPPESWGWPAWRSLLTFVPPQVPELPGSPRALHSALTDLGHESLGLSPEELVRSWGMGTDRLSAPWHQLDPSEAQRALLALVIARKPAVLLLDRPTQSIRGATARAVEADLQRTTAIWAPSSPGQRERLVGGGARTLTLLPRA